ncbi:uncharacterized protein LY79DRAFT_689593 [Colletotrichum navitas]|uniref:TLC domain-containing protein n=1 Tax=Colletotrichum navitas TaxID=681940 RepID=A0AAD8PHP5_9PEZI|nr:uncharacterized protein LY79DRAFT_689593 [Colletotrichum navitas]KAK1561261.1 hypothetical protein LY79DRAFT_689593 [Colletotrichum navitas]
MSTISSTLGSRSLPKISTISNGPLSYLQPYGTLFFVSSIIILVILCNILERWLLRALYGSIYMNLQAPGNEKQRRSFTHYHVGAMNMIFVLCIGFYPVMEFIAGPAELSTPMAAGSRVRVGDLLFIVAQAYPAYYTYELCYRTKFGSPISIAHHVGLIAIMQTSLSLFNNWEKHPEASLEFYMCMVWGTFDAITELPVLISLIIWRTRRNESKLLAYLAGGLFVWMIVGSLTEVAVTAYLLHKSWDRWGTVWKFVTPFIFSLWTCTQLFGASRLYSMSQSEWRKYKRGGVKDIEPVVDLHESDCEKETASLSTQGRSLGRTDNSNEV